MKSARQVAQELAAKFLEKGNYSFGIPMKRAALKQLMPAVAPSPSFDEFFEEAGFEGLAVQSVGYEKGADEPRVHIYLAKGSKKGLQSIPNEESGVKIEVTRMGKLQVRPEQANAATNQGNVFLRNNRVACGSSCAPSGENYSGTFGALVRKKGSSSAIFVLSNNHVLAACNHVSVGMPILSPSSMDGRPGARAPGEIARHEEIHELRSGEPTLVTPCQEDVALARVTEPKIVSSWQGHAGNGFDTPATVTSPVSGMHVKKVGRTSGLTEGLVEAYVNTPTPIPYKARHFSATVWVQNVWTVRATSGAAFALPGDSGSLVVTEDEGASIGLIFAAQGEYGWIIPMVHVVSLFGGLLLVNGHGT